MITIYQSSGKPAEGKKVALGFSSLLRGVTSGEYTDRHGEAHFNADNGNGKVYVPGTTRHEGYLSGRVVVYI
jgi:hypothetical protein